MEIYLTQTEAVCGLHSKGYINDFRLFGNDLLWIQQKEFIRAGTFSIIEYHRFYDRARKGSEIIVFAIVASLCDAKGILLNDYSGYMSKTPPIIIKKLAEMSLSGVWTVR